MLVVEKSLEQQFHQQLLDYTTKHWYFTVQSRLVSKREWSTVPRHAAQDGSADCQIGYTLNAAVWACARSRSWFGPWRGDHAIFWTGHAHPAGLKTGGAPAEISLAPARLTQSTRHSFCRPFMGKSCVANWQFSSFPAGGQNTTTLPPTF
jgi:hypothetical protein